jgi:hypothetical protein
MPFLSPTEIMVDLGSSPDLGLQLLPQPQSRPQLQRC